MWTLGAAAVNLHAGSRLVSWGPEGTLPAATPQEVAMSPLLLIVFIPLFVGGVAFVALLFAAATAGSRDAFEQPARWNDGRQGGAFARRAVGAFVRPSGVRRGRPGNIPTATAWSSVCCHASTRVGPLTIRMSDPRRPSTIQTSPPPAPLSAPSPIDQPACSSCSTAPRPRPDPPPANSPPAAWCPPPSPALPSLGAPLLVQVVPLKPQSELTPRTEDRLNDRHSGAGQARRRCAGRRGTGRPGTGQGTTGDEDIPF